MEVSLIQETLRITHYAGETITLAGCSVCEVSKLQHDEVRPVL
jgi:hypothetical protein